MFLSHLRTTDCCLSCLIAKLMGFHLVWCFGLDAADEYNCAEILDFALESLHSALVYLSAADWTEILFRINSISETKGTKFITQLLKNYVAKIVRTGLLNLTLTQNNKTCDVLTLLSSQETLTRSSTVFATCFAQTSFCFAAIFPRACTFALAGGWFNRGQWHYEYKLNLTVKTFNRMSRSTGTILLFHSMQTSRQLLQFPRQQDCHSEKNADKHCKLVKYKTQE